MDRAIVYAGQIPLDTDLLSTNKNAYLGLSKLAAAILGTNTVVNGLGCVPTAPASLTVNVNPGEIYSLQNIDATGYGSLSLDTTHSIVKQGISLDAVNLNCPAPGTTGQSINYLIEASFTETDTNLIVLPYYNSTNPAQAFAGPNNNGSSQATVRKDGISLVAKAGVAATTGTQTTPSADVGFVGLWVVTVANGQTTITAGNISQLAGAPFLNITLPQSAPLSQSVDTITTSTTLTNADVGRHKNITAAADTTLPAAGSVNIGDWIVFKNSTSGAKIRILPQGTDTLDGQGSGAPYRLPGQQACKIMKVAAGAWSMVERPGNYVGQVDEWYMSTLPTDGWILANNTPASRTNQGNLFDLWGTTYGVGDGSTTFGLPPIYGRTTVAEGQVVVSETDGTSVAANAQVVGSNTATWITGMCVRASSTVSLPTGLAAATDYFIVRVDATHVSFASTFANAQNGTVISISGGSGNITITTAGATAQSYNNHVLGETGGEEAHGMSITEILSHGHGIQTSNGAGGTPNLIGSATTGLLAQLNTLTIGGNVAMNILQPYFVVKKIIKT